MTERTVTYDVMINLETRHKNLATFAEAWEKMVKEVKKEIRAGTSWQVLETAYFLIAKANGKKIPFSFYNARDIAYKLSLMRNGELVRLNDPVATETKFLSTIFTTTIK